MTKEDTKLSILMPPSTIPEEMVFTSRTSNFLHHVEVRMKSCPETISHRLIRSKSQATSETDSSLCAEFPHTEREDRLEACVPLACPPFLVALTSTRAASLPFQPLVSSRAVEYRHQDHLQVRIDSRLFGRDLLLHGSYSSQGDQQHYSTPETGGLGAARPSLGWSGMCCVRQASLD